MTQRALPIQLIQDLLLLTIAEAKISSFIEGLKKEEQTLFYQKEQDHFLQARGNFQCRQSQGEDTERGLLPIFPTPHFMLNQTV